MWIDSKGRHRKGLLLWINFCESLALWYWVVFSLQLKYHTLKTEENIEKMNTVNLTLSSLRVTTHSERLHLTHQMLRLGPCCLQPLSVHTARVCSRQIKNVHTELESIYSFQEDSLNLSHRYYIQCNGFHFCSTDWRRVFKLKINLEKNKITSYF